MPKANSKLALRIGDDAVKAKTGRTWGEWFALLDKAGARTLNHKQIVALLSETHSLGPWWEQMVTVGYEQGRGLREKHQGPRGYEISKSLTVAAPVTRVFRAFQNQTERAKWLAHPGITIRKATPHKSLRVTWVDGKTSLEVGFYPKGARKTQLAVQHSKISTAARAMRLKGYWAAQLERLRAQVEA